MAQLPPIFVVHSSYSFPLLEKRREAKSAASSPAIVAVSGGAFNWYLTARKFASENEFIL
jgi:hypothetical protein